MKQSQLYLLLLILFITACSQQNADLLSKRIAEIQQNNIPDKRLLYWDVEIKIENNTSKISGATASEKAYRELQTLASEQNLDFDVVLYPTDDFKENPWGIVTLSVCNIRGKSRHSAELVTQALMGTPVKVYAKDDGWYLVQTPDRYFGWVDAAGVALKTSKKLAEWKSFEKVIYKNQSGFAFAETIKASDVESDLILADLLSIIGEENDFYKIEMADGRQAFVKKDECVSLEIWKAKSFTVENLLATASSFKGIPYLWGGTSAKMADCSGFTKSVYFVYGIILQRDASQQTLYGELVDTEKGYDNIKPGDLLFFGRKATDSQKEKVTHVGLYLGGQEFMHASGKVRINSLNKESDNYTEYYETAFVRARRIVVRAESKGIEWVVDNAFYKEILPE
jgi:hypothetical protein